MAKIGRTWDTVECNQGTGPGVLLAIHGNVVQIDGQSAANEWDFTITACGMCRSKSNPAVIETKGVPVACTPDVGFMWDKTSDVVRINGHPAVTSKSKLTCALGGKVSVKGSSAPYVNISK